MFLPALQYVRKKGKSQPLPHAVLHTTSEIKIGDIVTIDGLTITGKVNRLGYRDFGKPNRFDILVQGTNGIPVILENIHITLIQKISQE
jgi:hypothetical protein